MRILATVILLLMTPIVIAGVIYVPFHDGRVIDSLILIFLPVLGICWSIWQLLPHSA